MSRFLCKYFLIFQLNPLLAQRTKIARFFFYFTKKITAIKNSRHSLSTNLDKPCFTKILFFILNIKDTDMNYSIFSFEDTFFSISSLFTDSNNILYDLFYTPLKYFLIITGFVISIWLFTNFFLRHLFEKLTKIKIPPLLSAFTGKQNFYMRLVYIKLLFPIHPKTERHSIGFKESVPQELHRAYFHSVITAPEDSSWYSKNEAYSLENKNLTVFHLPEKLWEEGGKEITAILNGKKELPLENLANIEIIKTHILLKRIISSALHLKILQLDASKFVSEKHEKYIQEQRYFRIFYDVRKVLGYFANLSKDENFITKEF